MFVIVLTIINVFKYSLIGIDSSLSGKVWYRYNYNNGLYETLEFKDNEINYFKPTGTNNINSLDSCTKYNYNKTNNTIELNCKKNIHIISYDKNSLTLEFDSKSEKYFTDIEDSLNYEFENYFNKSIVDYKKERQQVTDFSLINQNKTIEVIKNNEYSKIIFIRDNCTSINCVLALDIMEKWISTNENIYYAKINNNIINYLNSINNNKYDLNYFDNGYPLVLVTKNNKVVDEYYIKCTGFNCNNYYKNEF